METWDIIFFPYILLKGVTTCGCTDYIARRGSHYGHIPAGDQPRIGQRSTMLLSRTCALFKCLWYVSECILYLNFERNTVQSSSSSLKSRWERLAFLGSEKLAVKKKTIAVLIQFYALLRILTSKNPKKKTINGQQNGRVSLLKRKSSKCNG